MATKLPIPHAVEAVVLARRQDRSPTRRSATPFNEWKHYRGGTHVAHLVVLRSSDARGRAGPAAGGALQRHRPDVDRRHGLLPLRPRRRVQPLLLRPGTKKVEAAHEVHRLPGRSTRAPAAARSSSSRPATSTCSTRRPGNEPPAEDRRRGRLVETRPRFVKGRSTSADAPLSPTGARAAFEYPRRDRHRPAEKGDARNLTNTPGANERSPGLVARRQVDRLLLRRAAASTSCTSRRRTARARRATIKLDGAGFYDDPKWSPDGKKIAFADNSQSLYCIDVASRHVDKDRRERRLYGPASACSITTGRPTRKWLAYTRNTPHVHAPLYVYSLATEEVVSASPTD